MKRYLVILLLVISTLKISAQSTFYVTSTTDVNPMAPAVGELRYAIEQANANPGLDNIVFQISASTATSPIIIQPQAALPPITDAVIIDGSTQSLPLYTGLEPHITIDGTNVPNYYAAPCFYNYIGNCTFTNLTITNFAIGYEEYENVSSSATLGNTIISNNVFIKIPYACLLFNATSSNNVVSGNYFGTDHSLTISNVNKYATAIVLGVPEYSSPGVLESGIGVASNNIIGTNSNPNYFYSTSTTSHASDGVTVGNGNGNQIEYNVFVGNTYNINLAYFEGTSAPPRNNNKVPPVFTLTTASSITGTGITGDNIQIYKSNSTGVDAVSYLGSATVSGGVWSTSIAGLNVGDNLVAIATDASGNTSQFASSTVSVSPPYPNCCTTINTFATNLTITSPSGAPITVGNASLNSIITFNISSVGSSCPANQNYTINFGDGSPTAGFSEFNYYGTTVGIGNNIYYQTNHTYTLSGTYNVLITISGGECTSVTQQYYTITVPPSNPPCCTRFTASTTNLQTYINDYEFWDYFLGNAALEFYGLGCQNAPITFNINTSTSTCPAGQTYAWNFGDGSSTAMANGASVSHTYANPGTYYVSLTVTGTGGCISTIDNFYVVEIINCCCTNPVIGNQAANVASGGNCTDSPILFVYGDCPGIGIVQGTNWVWNFGDGTPPVTQTNTSPVPGEIFHTYPAPGTYYTTLTINAPECSSPITATEKVIILNCNTVNCNNCIGSFAPDPGDYIVGVWVREDWHSSSNAAAVYTYTNSAVSISFFPPSVTYNFIPNSSTDPIIDGWQRIEGKFTVPVGAVSMNISLNNNNTNPNVNTYFDDIRVHPFNGNMKTYVYDPITLRLSAELDENNYATFYEYDEEGKLIRVKKETQRGIMTVKESRSSNKKSTP